MPQFEDAHDPPNKFLFPDSRNESYKYYNKMNAETPVLPDPDAPVEYDDWMTTKGPPPLQI